MYEGQGQTKAISPIIARTEELGKGLEEIEDRLKFLQERLSPILLHDVSKDPNEKGGIPMTTKSPLSLRLDTLGGQIDNCLFFINKLIERVEI